MLNEAPDNTGLSAEDNNLDGRIAAAATPSKQKMGGFKIAPNEAFIASPPEFVLESLPTEPLPALDTVGRNLTQMAETLTTVVKEVYHLTQDLAHQDSFQIRLCNKTNYLAAVVGTPPDDIKVPIVWSAIMELYSQLNDEGRNTPSKAFAQHENLVSRHSVAWKESWTELVYSENSTVFAP
ncbi:hypothetical protein ACA910_019942 [Epithemia clementina (nom. ined.)]